MKTMSVNRKWFEDSGVRLDASFHLSDGLLTLHKLKKCPYPMGLLKDETERIFKGGIFKRTYVDSIENGYNFITASDMMKSDILGAKFISKKYSSIDHLFVDKGWTLVSRSGTLGNTAFTNEIFEDKVLTDDLIRIVPNNKNILGGYLYAFLSSHYGYGLLTQSGYGGVVQHIEPHHIENIPIPILPEATQQKIHNLITEASQLRVQANKLLKEAQQQITRELNIFTSKATHAVNISTLRQTHHKRFEAYYYTSTGSDYRAQIEKKEHKLLGELSERIFRPGIFKRHYVNEGVDFLGGSDITSAIPASEKKLARAKTGNYDQLELKEDWILVTCGGTIGTTVLVNEHLSQKLASQHILRVVPKDIPTGYLFAFMNSEIGLKLIQSFMYGSVIQQIEPHHLALLPIPILSDQIMTDTHNDVMKYKHNLNLAIKMELEAIDLIEKEIDQWQQL